MGRCGAWRGTVLAVVVEVLSGTSWVWADGSPVKTGGGLMSFFPLVLVGVIMYFLLIRPQQKQARQQRNMVDALKRGDRILTQSGFYATVVAVKGKVLEVKLNDDVKVLLNKSAVTQVLSGDPAQEPEESQLVPANSHK